MRGFRDFLEEAKKAPKVPNFEPANTATPAGDKNRRKKNDRNVKEGAENLKELSTDTLGRYKKAAVVSAKAADARGDFKTGNKRLAGVNLATKKQFRNDAKDPNDKVDALRRRVDSDREASRNAQQKKMNEDTLEEGWLFGSRYKKIGNKSGSTHRVTFKHLPTDSKHTVDVTAPTDRHAEAHVHRHVLGGRNGTAPIRITRMVHLHEGTETMNEEEDLQELSIKKLNAYQSKASKEVRQIKSNSNYGGERSATKLMANRIKGIARANKSRIAQSEEQDIQEVSKDTLRSYVGKAKSAYDSKYKELSTPSHTGPVWGDMKGRIKKFDDQMDKLSKRREGINRAKAKLGEDLDEALEIRHAINHGDSQARHHAREHKKALTAYNAGHAKLASQYRALTRDQEDELMNHYEVAAHHHREYKKRLAQLEAGKNTKNEDLDLQELSRNTLHSYLARARGNRNAAANRRDAADEKWEKASRAHRDGTAKTAHTGDYQRQTMKIQSSVSKAADRTIEKRTKGIAAARSRLTKEDLNENAGVISAMTVVRNVMASRKRPEPHKEQPKTPEPEKKPEDQPELTGSKIQKASRHRQLPRTKLDEGIVKKIVRAVTGRAEAGKRADRHYDQGDDIWGGDEGRKFRRNYRAGRRYDQIATNQPKTFKFGSRKEDLDEGLVSKITNAAKNLNKMTKGSDQRFSDAREKASFDKAKGTDLSPRGRALRKIEKLQWSKQNPVKAPKPIVPMGKLPDKVWSTDSDKPKPKRVTDDSLDQPMFRKAGAMSRRFKTEGVIEEGVTVAVPVEIDGKKYSAVNGQAYVHSNMIMGRWNTKKRAMRKALKPGAHHDKIIAALEKHKSERYKEESLDEASDWRNRGWGQKEGDWDDKGPGRETNNEMRRKRANAWSKKTDAEKAHAVKRTMSSDKRRATIAANAKAAKAARAAERKAARDHQKKMDSVKSPTGRPFGQAEKPDTRSDYQKKLDGITARIKSRPFGQTSEELDPKGGSKFLKEKPKRDPKTGKLEKSKAFQKIEACIKMSGKKEKVDTEPTYNPLSSASNGDGTPNA
jgi:hypothetical protein